jgi:acetyl esterase/lipase
LYRAATEPRPLVLYLHGGGFVLGDLESHDSICRRLALIADVAVLAVDYRRAPEHPGPAPREPWVGAGGRRIRRKTHSRNYARGISETEFGHKYGGPLHA